MQQQIAGLTSPDPIEDRVYPARWLKGHFNDAGDIRGFFFPAEGTPGWDFIRDASDESFVEGPFAVGKSQILAFKIHWKCLSEPGSRCGFLRLTKESVKGSIIPTYYKILGYNPTLSKTNYVIGYGGENPQRFLYRNGSRVDVLGMNHPDDFLSTEFHAMGIPQAEEFTESHWELVSRRTRSGQRTQVFGDVNPSFEQHFLNNSPHIFRYKMTHQENPEYWDRVNECWTEKGELEISKLQRMKGTRYKRGYLGLWCAQEGVVYDMYLSELHDVEIPNTDQFSSDTRWNVSVDYGHSRPYSCNFWALDPNGVHYHFKEIYRSKIRLQEFIERIHAVREQWNIPEVENMFCDHNAEHNDEMMRQGFPVNLAEKDVLPGIDAVKNHLESGTLKFNKFALTRFEKEGEDQNLFGHPKCLRDELGVYAYRREDQRTFTQKDEYPIEYGDHAMDSMRYYIMGTEHENDYYPIHTPAFNAQSAGYASA